MKMAKVLKTVADSTLLSFICTVKTISTYQHFKKMKEEKLLESRNRNWKKKKLKKE